MMIRSGYGTHCPVQIPTKTKQKPQTSAGWPAERVRAFMRFLLGADSPLPCRIDQSRCYVTGHSMGGSGALVSWA